MSINSFSINKPPNNPVFLGKIGSSYGIYGWCKIFSFTENITNIVKYQPWFIKNENKYYLINIESWKNYKNNLIIKFKEINDRNIVKKLTNSDILIDYYQLPKLDNNQYYWRDLINCSVININGNNLGKVINLIDTVNYDILIIKKNINDKFFVKEILIPFINEKIIKKVDLINKIIEVNWITKY